MFKAGYAASVFAEILQSVLRMVLHLGLDMSGAFGKRRDRADEQVTTFHESIPPNLPCWRFVNLRRY